MSNKDNRWLYIAILSFVIALIWVGATIIIKQRKSTIPPDLEKVTQPLDPTIDRSILIKLSKRKAILAI